uniref:Uncharacterized protein n=1 Tax=Arundo donax TaxID=35708 RepID=A0A0A9E0Q5_ARUDO
MHLYNLQHCLTNSQIYICVDKRKEKLIEKNEDAKDTIKTQTKIYLNYTTSLIPPTIPTLPCINSTTQIASLSRSLSATSLIRSKTNLLPSLAAPHQESKSPRIFLLVADHHCNGIVNSMRWISGSAGGPATARMAAARRRRRGGCRSWRFPQPGRRHCRAAPAWVPRNCAAAGRCRRRQGGRRRGRRGSCRRRRRRAGAAAEGPWGRRTAACARCRG